MTTREQDQEIERICLEHDGASTEVFPDQEDGAALVVVEGMEYIVDRFGGRSWAHVFSKGWS